MDGSKFLGHPDQAACVRYWSTPGKRPLPENLSRMLREVADAGPEQDTFHWLEVQWNCDILRQEEQVHLLLMRYVHVARKRHAARYILQERAYHVACWYLRWLKVAYWEVEGISIAAVLDAFLRRLEEPHLEAHTRGILKHIAALEKLDVQHPPKPKAEADLTDQERKEVTRQYRIRFIHVFLIGNMIRPQNQRWHQWKLAMRRKRRREELERRLQRCPHGLTRSNFCLSCQGCEHGLRKSECKVCSRCSHGKPVGKCAVCNACAHGLAKGNCAQCNLCPHGRRKGACKLCNGCEHGERRDRCVTCSPCPHGKLKQDCKTCTGCKHGKLKRFCQICSQCCHGKYKRLCKICSGCRHGNLRQLCKRCTARRRNAQGQREGEEAPPNQGLRKSQDCEHKKRRWLCRECNPTCEHGRLQGRCFKCNEAAGLDACPHGHKSPKEGVFCLECHGCTHKRLRWMCRECNPPCEHGRLQRYCRKCKEAGLDGNEPSSARTKTSGKPPTFDKTTDRKPSGKQGGRSAEAEEVGQGKGIRQAKKMRLWKGCEAGCCIQSASCGSGELELEQSM
ncbi:unnamed protein product [Effrenium voratum]|uniref:Uncharacterized protein n=1 Tax=Effrenium voratum TaxID=2562239 RepID=A0AA36MTU6_9DINO|nr:unnamed protein product [Effrenium voratum]CAJ1457446.1 unnamed protein product [Effrenium voratum]